MSDKLLDTVTFSKPSELDELIDQLTAIRAKHGNMLVTTWDSCDAEMPIAEIDVLDADDGDTGDEMPKRVLLK